MGRLQQNLQEFWESLVWSWMNGWWQLIWMVAVWRHLHIMQSKLVLFSDHPRKATDRFQFSEKNRPVAFSLKPFIATVWRLKGCLKITNAARDHLPNFLKNLHLGHRAVAFCHANTRKNTTEMSSNRALKWTPDTAGWWSLAALGG